MTALERLKAIEDRAKVWAEKKPGAIMLMDENPYVIDQFHRDIVTALRAFKVMKDIAAQYKQDAEVRMNDKDLRVPIWIYLEASIEEEFERRMKEGE